MTDTALPDPTKHKDNLHFEAIGRFAVPPDKLWPFVSDTQRLNRVLALPQMTFRTEPLPTGHPFYRLDNVLLSPHCADHKAGWLEEAMHFFLGNLARFRRGEPLENVVDKRRGY